MLDFVFHTRFVGLAPEKSPATRIIAWYAEAGTLTVSNVLNCSVLRHHVLLHFGKFEFKSRDFPFSANLICHEKHEVNRNDY